MKYLNITSYIVVVLGLIVMNSCSKYLNAKPDKSLAIPSSLGDLQSLLDYYPTMNASRVNAGEASSDDYYLPDEIWQSTSEDIQKMYLWKSDTVFKPNYNDWQTSYAAIYTANTVLHNIASLKRTSTNEKEWDNISGQALFFRANSFLQVAFVWAKAYDQATATQDLGIPLRLDIDFNAQSSRSSVQQTYDQIIKDLKGAIRLLPNTQVHPMRPGKPAAYGLLARAYLSMRKYDSAFVYSDSSLKLNNQLLNYNNIDPTPSYPIPRFNAEVLFSSNIRPPSNSERIDSTILVSYDNNDLRKLLYTKDNHDGTYSFRGSYEGVLLFDGVSTDEMYLIRSECEARAGKVNLALEDLNTLLSNRWATSTYIPYSTNDQNDALNIILKERRKELLMRGIRWMDIKRLNKEGRNIILKRIINGQLYTLSPNANRYALPIPEDVIQRSGMKQNPN